jgi:hypothetical protein
MLVSSREYRPASAERTTGVRLIPIMQPGVGNIAINDAFLLEGAIYFLLKKHFRQEKYYVDLLELFHDVSAVVASRILRLLMLLLSGHIPNGNWSVDRPDHGSRRQRRPVQVLS